MSEFLDDDRSDFDQELADSYVGKYTLVQLNVFNPGGEFLECQHLHGVIAQAGPGGISVELGGGREGEVYVLAPILDAFEKGTLEIYELNNGEMVEAPDLLGYFKVTKAAN